MRRAKRVYYGFTAKMQNETILKWDIIEKKKCFTMLTKVDIRKKQMDLDLRKMHLCCKNLDLHLNNEGKTQG